MSSFPKLNQDWRHSLLDLFSGIYMYSNTRGLRRWTLVHPIGTDRLGIFFLFSSFFLYSSTTKKYF
jgi:hypothetical protein